MIDLSARRCAPCEGGVTPLTRVAAEEVLQRLDENWQLALDAASIQREFRFKDFFRTMSFVNAVAHVVNLEDHHPDLEVGYATVACASRRTRSAGFGERLHLRGEDRPAAARIKKKRFAVALRLTSAIPSRAAQAGSSPPRVNSWSSPSTMAPIKALPLRRSRS
jgi:4a-hydroxytetrahydrobiopterin dehydratase